MPALASVVFAKIADFPRRTVAEQARFRAQLEAALAVALVDIDPANRVVLDAPDGIAVAVLGDAAGALDIARRCLNSTAAGVPISIAVNHGAILFANEDDDRHGLIGDAIGAASAIAHFAGPARLLVSKSFRDALSEAAPGSAASLRPAGVFTDGNVRTHELFTLGAESAPRRRKVLTGIGIVLIAVIGTAATLFRDDVQRELRAGDPAVLAFDIHPDGDIYVNGFPRGKSPPLIGMQLEPGQHSVEIRKKGHAAAKFNFQLEAGKTTTVRHDFEPRPERGLFTRLWDAITRQ
jgi:hypothetical protein